MKHLLPRIRENYETAIAVLLEQITSPGAYGLFIPYYGWGMGPGDNADAGCTVHLLDAAWKKKVDTSEKYPPRPGGYFCCGEFFGEVPSLKLEAAELRADLLAYFTYMHSDEDFEEEATVRIELGLAIAAACLNLNARGWSGDDKQLAPNFVVFTDYMEPGGRTPNLANSVSPEWLSARRAEGLIDEFTVRYEG